MKAHSTKVIGEGLTYDDVLLIPNYSEVLPREVSIQSKFLYLLSESLNFAISFLRYPGSMAAKAFVFPMGYSEIEVAPFR